MLSDGMGVGDHVRGQSYRNPAVSVEGQVVTRLDVQGKVLLLLADGPRRFLARGSHGYRRAAGRPLSATMYGWTVVTAVTW